MNTIIASRGWDLAIIIFSAFHSGAKAQKVEVHEPWTATKSETFHKFVRLCLLVLKDRQTSGEKLHISYKC